MKENKPFFFIVLYQLSLVMIDSFGCVNASTFHRLSDDDRLKETFN